MKNSNQNLHHTLDTAADQWLIEWVEECARDFENIELDEFILID